MEEERTMPRRSVRRLTPLETLVMDAVWGLSEATVHQVRERLAPVKPLAYNTVLTVMRTLRAKGALASRREGKTDLYRPAVTREQMSKPRLRELLDHFFSGSPAALVSSLLGAETVSPDDLKAIRREIDRKLAKERED
jgi:predicted transcriptional regulator